MSIDTWLQTIAEQGLLGVLLIVVGVGYYKKDQRVGELNKEKLELAERVFRIAEKLTDLVKQNGGKNA
jgi:hypothetical protein